MALVNICQEETVKLLCGLFKPGTEFWEYWNMRKMKYFEAFSLEGSGNINKETDYFDLADFKSELGKVAIDALHLLSDKKNAGSYKNLLLAHRNFSIANQLIDDIQDITIDRDQKQFNWVLRHLFDLLADNGVDTKNLNHEQLKKHLYSSNLAIHYYKKANTFFAKALRHAEKAQAVLWKEHLKKLYTKNAHRIDTIRGYNLVLRTKANIRKEANSLISEIPIKIPKITLGKYNLSPSIAYLLNECESGYTDLKHIMYLSNLEGFANNNEIHIGDSFQRAILADLFYDIHTRYPVNLSKIIDKEINYLVKQRNYDAIGGWSYFPSVPEIAADIDDLGQIAQLLIKSRRFDFLEKYGMKPINFAIEHCLVKGGGLKTWIIPRDKRNEYQERQHYFNQTKWGEGPDVEVVANFLYALYLIDPFKYKKTINQQTDYLINAQAPEGYWKSRWYYGNYYGTYICARMLNSTNNSVNEKPIQNAFNYILKTQNTDGGWGMNGLDSDALNTSFALQSLKLIKPEKAKLQISKAKAFILSCRQKDYSWEPVNFIRPRFNDPYRSRTLTTACVLKSLID